MSLKKLRQDALLIFETGLNAVDVEVAVHKYLRCEGNSLLLENQTYNLDNYRNIYVVGAGKATAAMAKAVEELISNRITDGIINVKYGHTESLKKIKLNEAGHPLPDKAGERGAKEIVSLLNPTNENDLVICLISGGGSALMPLPADGISLSEKQALTDQLLACGASISEINTVRKHISKIKGGQLARFAYPSQLITLILSDVIGDSLDTIASGPTVPDSTTFEAAKMILYDYDLLDSSPDSISTHIESGVRNRIPETPKAGDVIFSRTQNVIIGSNIRALIAAKEKAENLGYNAMILSSFIEGETKEAARVHAAVAKQIVQDGNPLNVPACVISGGETTVTLQGHGKGGRNQEFVLAAAIDIADLNSVVILSAGTDGTDGPTDAAGAICDGKTVCRAESIGMKASEHLYQHDAYPFFERLEDLIMTGATNTNVMDLRLILVGF